MWDALADRGKQGKFPGRGYVMEIGSELLEKFEKYFGPFVTKVALMTLVFSGCIAALGIALTPAFQLFRGMMASDPRAYAVFSDLLLALYFFGLVSMIAMSITLRHQNRNKEQDLAKQKLSFAAEHAERNKQFYTSLESFRRTAKEQHDQIETLIAELTIALPDGPAKSTFLANAGAILQQLRASGFYQKAAKPTWPPKNE